MKPHISIDGKEVMFEWWDDNRKLSCFVTERGVEYLKVWGPNMYTDMEEGKVEDIEMVLSLYSWLKGKE